MKNPFDNSPNPFLARKGKKIMSGDTPRSQSKEQAPEKGYPLWTPLFHQPARLDAEYAFAPLIQACTGMISTSIIRQAIYET
jgi:hypothetical protein